MVHCVLCAVKLIPLIRNFPLFQKNRFWCVEPVRLNKVAILRLKELSKSGAAGGGVKREVKKSKKRDTLVKAIITTENQVDSSAPLSRFLRNSGRSSNMPSQLSRVLVIVTSTKRSF